MGNKKLEEICKWRIAIKKVLEDNPEIILEPQPLHTCAYRCDGKNKFCQSYIPTFEGVNLGY